MVSTNILKIPTDNLVQKDLVCDFQKTVINKSHNLGSTGLKKDPFKRTKQITRKDGERFEEVMRLCRSCYKQALIEKGVIEGQVCDLQQIVTEKSHDLGSTGLIRDPLKRTKQIKNKNGTTLEQVMRLCQSCYQEAFGEKLVLEGIVCDLQQTLTDKSHNLDSRGLRKDPHQRTRLITNKKGKTLEQVMQLCRSCYQKALSEKTVIEGRVCDLKQTVTGKPHNLDVHGLKKDPLKRIKEITNEDGETLEQVMRLCNSCYQQALSVRSVAEGQACDLKQTVTGKSHSLGSTGLIKDPLKRTKQIANEDGEILKQVIRLCQSCYQQALGQKAASEGKTCDLKQAVSGKSHNLDSHGLKKDPRKRTKLMTNKNGETLEQVVSLCRSCYRQALGEKKATENHIGGLQQAFPGKSNNSGTCDLTIDLSKKVTKTISLKLPSTQDAEATLLVTDDEELIEDELEIGTSDEECYFVKRKTTEDQVGNLLAQNTNNFSSVNLEVIARAATVITNPEVALQPNQTATRLITIKEEPTEGEVGDGECYFTTFRRNEHQVDNTLPILQDPKDPSRSQLKEAEGDIDDITTVRWGYLAGITKDQKEQIREEMREWLHLAESDRETYAKRLDESFEVAIAIEHGPERGRGVYAKKTIKQYEVVGPYAGKLHTNPESLQRAIRYNGSYDVLSYLFATRSAQRSVDAFNTGNTMSLVNTSQLPGQSAWAQDNVAAVTFGRNLTFYIALRDIDVGEELLLDYGLHYNPMSMIKQEKD